MAAPPVTPGGTPREPGDSNMSRTYAGVLIVWVLVLVALFLFQQYFSS